MATTYTLISSQVLGSSTASITFSSIPQTYTDLYLECSIRTDRNSVQDELSLVFNSDTSALYSSTWLGMNGNSGTAALSSNNSGWGYARFGIANGATTTASTFAPINMYLSNYTGVYNKVFYRYSVPENNATTGAWLETGANLYRSTSASANAISSITISSANGTNLVANSSLYLYGVKNS